MQKTKAVLKTKLAHLNQSPSSHGYIVDEQGQEVRITSKMIKLACQKLLQQCRAIHHM